MPSPRLWTSRRPLYRLNLAVLLTLTPFNLLGMLLPYWLKTKAVMTSADQGRVILKDVSVQYGIWRQCSDVMGCRWIHDDHIDADVGDWMVPIAIFMVLSTLCQLTAAVLGASQNFLPRDFSRHVRLKLLRKVLHRDCPYTEDVGFLAGFFGSLSCIIFLLGTKDKISDGAHYQWAFAFSFISSTLTVMASLTLTKTHLMTAPRPPSRRRPGSSPRSPERDGGGGGASSSLSAQPAGAVRTVDVRLEEAQRAGDGRSSARRTEPQSRSSRTRRSSPGSRERSRRSGSRQDRPASSTVSQSRLVRSPELENIPAAVTPSAAQGASGGALSRGSRTAPVMCLQMSDLQSSAAMSQAESASAVSGETPSSSGAAVSGARGGETRAGSGKTPKGSRTQETSFHSSEPDRTHTEDVVMVVVVTPPGENNASAQGGDDSLTSRSRISTDDGAAASNVVMSQRL